MYTPKIASHHSCGTLWTRYRISVISKWLFHVTKTTINLIQLDNRRAINVREIGLFNHWTWHFALEFNPINLLNIIQSHLRIFWTVMHRRFSGLSLLIRRAYSMPALAPFLFSSYLIVFPQLCHAGINTFTTLLLWFGVAPFAVGHFRTCVSWCYVTAICHRRLYMYIRAHRFDSLVFNPYNPIFP